VAAVDTARREGHPAASVDRTPKEATAEGTTGRQVFEISFFPLGPAPVQRGSGPFFGQRLKW